MALYDSLFTMMDMQAAQLLVTASDFEHDGAPPLAVPRQSRSLTVRRPGGCGVHYVWRPAHSGRGVEVEGESWVRA